MESMGAAIVGGLKTTMRMTTIVEKGPEGTVAATAKPSCGIASGHLHSLDPVGLDDDRST